MEKKIHFIKTLSSDKNKPDFEYISMIKEFDIHGNLILIKEFDEENNLIFEHKQQYNENKKVIFEDIISYTDNYQEKKTFTYNEEGNLESEKIEYDGGWYSIKKYELSPDKKMLKIHTLDEDDETEEITVIEYDEKGKVVCQKEFDENEKLKSVSKTEYNDDDTVSCKEEYDSKGKIDRVYDYFYNQNNKLAGVKTSNHKGKALDWIKMEYDDADNIVEQLSMSGSKIEISEDKDKYTTTETYKNPNGEITNQIITVRNEEGNILEEHSLSKIAKYFYEYF
jgi:hypothetical protein